MRPRVALTTSLTAGGGEYRQPQVTLYANYLTALARVGLTTVLVTPAHGQDEVGALLDVCDGLVLSGGEDVAPTRYGEDPIPGLFDVSPARDAVEWWALDAALDAGLPVLGICRGLQVLNVYFGGTLYQDLPGQLGGGVGHYQALPWGRHHHTVRCCEGGTRLRAALEGCGAFGINSFHHQAIRDLAPALVCAIRAEDGLIEGVESTEHAWVVGVQWHPERHEAEATTDDPNIRVLRAFADAVTAR